MFKELNPMDEIHMIQEKIFKEEKHLSSKEKIRKIRRELKAASSKYRLKFKIHK